MGTHLRVFSKIDLMNTNMTGFRQFSKIFAFLCFGQSSLSIGRVNPFMPECLLDKVVLTFDTFEINIGINHKFTKYLKKSCGLDFDLYFSFKYFLKMAFVRDLINQCHLDLSYF